MGGFEKPGLNDLHLSHSGLLFFIVRAVLLPFSPSWYYFSSGLQVGLFSTKVQSTSPLKKVISASTSQPYCLCHSTVLSLPIKCVNFAINECLTWATGHWQRLQRWGAEVWFHPPRSLFPLSSPFLHWPPHMANKALLFGPEQVFSQDKSPDTHWSLVLFTGCSCCCSHVKALAFNNPTRFFVDASSEVFSELCSFPLPTQWPWLLSLKQAMDLLNCICNEDSGIAKAYNRWESMSSVSSFPPAQRGTISSLLVMMNSTHS